MRQLAVLHGVEVDASAPSKGGGADSDRLVIGGAALAVVALAAVLAVLRSRRARVV